MDRMTTGSIALHDLDMIRLPCGHGNDATPDVMLVTLSESSFRCLRPPMSLKQDNLQLQPPPLHDRRVPMWTPVHACFAKPPTTPGTPQFALKNGFE